MRISVWIAVAVMTVSIVVNRVWARDLSAVKGSGTLILGSDFRSPPFSYYKNNELTGFEIDLSKALAKHFQLTPKFELSRINSLLIGLSQGRFDLMISSHTITPERSLHAQFTLPTYCANAVIVSLPGGPKTALDLKGKKVAVPVGAVYNDKLKAFPHIGKVMTFPDEITALQSLTARRTDVWVTDEMLAYEAQKNNPNAGLVVGESLFNEVNAWAVAKGNPELLVFVNKGLKALYEDGTYLTLMKRYFDRDIRCPEFRH